MDTKTKRLISLINDNKDLLKSYKEYLQKNPDSTFYNNYITEQQNYIEELEKELNKE